MKPPGPRARGNPSREPDPARIVPGPASRAGAEAAADHPPRGQPPCPLPPQLCISTGPAPAPSLPCSLEPFSDDVQRRYKVVCGLGPRPEARAGQYGKPPGLGTLVRSLRGWDGTFVGQNATWGLETVGRHIRVRRRYRAFPLAGS